MINDITPILPNSNGAFLKKGLVFLILMICSIFTICLFNNSSVHATTAGFDAGRIIDDTVFYNANSMSTNEIQSFLNSKVSSCDTNGTGTTSYYYNSSTGAVSMSSNDNVRGTWVTTTRSTYGSRFNAYTGTTNNGVPFTCLRDYSTTTGTRTADQYCSGYTSSNQSSAQIINNVAKSCGINPQVLIVMLQKEQGLVTDTWPQGLQYRSALGMGCPDTAACDSQYYGLFNQLYDAARQFKKYQAHQDSYNYLARRNNTILWNPNSTCGSSTVYIQNQATAALYIYTPYRPNQAALNAGYGSGDACSSYGNRNFYNYFTDWFGSTSGSLIRTYESGALYFFDGKQRYYVPNLDTLSEYGINTSYVRFVSQSEMNSIPVGGEYSTSLNRLIKSSTAGDIYLVNNAKKIRISSMDQFNSLGYTAPMITVMPQNFLDTLATSSKPLSSLFQAPNQAIVKLENQKKRSIFEMSVLNNETVTNHVTPLSNYNLSFWGYGDPIVYGDYVVVNNSGSVRLYRDGLFSYIPNMDIYNSWGVKNIKTFYTEFNISNGVSRGTLSQFAKNSTGDTFMVDGNSKYQLSSPDNISSISNVSDSMLDRLSTKLLKPAILSQTGQISLLENNVKRPITDMLTFADLGLTGNDLSLLSSNTYNALSTGARKIALGRLVVDNQGNAFAISSHTSKTYIPSMSIITAYGYSWGAATKLSPLENATYNTVEGSTLGNLIKTTEDSSLFAVVDGKAYAIDSSFNYPQEKFQTYSNKILPTSTPIAMSRFVKTLNSSTVYYIENGQKRPIQSWGTYLQLSNDGSTKIQDVPQNLLTLFPTGTVRS